MKKITSFLVFCLALSTAYSQQIVSSTYLGSVTKDSIGSIIGMPIFQFGADYYKLTYQSVDAKGNPDTLSALLTIPTSITENTYPVLFYEHGTAACKECVPSRYGQTGGDEGRAGLVFAGMGYISLLPDYVGMGDGRGFQTYVYDSTSYAASIDLLQAFRAWAPTQNILFNNQLFITGYSQGGYVAMAFHKYMQEHFGASSVTAAAHNSGPYSLSGVMRDLILVDSAYSYPAYIPNTMLGMNEVYEMFPNLSDFYKPEFVNDVQAYYDGNIELTELNERIKDTLVAYYGDTIAHYMIRDEILDSVQANPNYIINKILHDNDVHKWKPESPTRIFYCKADDQVPYRNSIVAIDTMYARGTDPNLVQAKDLDSTLTHTGCIEPAFLNTLIFFGNFQQVTLGTEEVPSVNLNVYPNPARDHVYIVTDLEGKTNVKVWSLNGQLKLDFNTENPAQGFAVNDFENGMYLLQITAANGAIFHMKFVVEK